MGLDYTALLTALAQGLTAVRDGSGPVTSGQLVHFHIMPTTLDLQVPVLLDGDVNLAFLTKSVRFADALLPTTDLSTYLADTTNVLGGVPVAAMQVPMQGPTLPGAIPNAISLAPRVTGAAPDVQLPGMTPPTPSADDALSGVPGLLGKLAGTIPIPAMAPVTLSVTWKILKADGTAASDGYTTAPGGSADGTDVFFIFFGDLQELTITGVKPTTFLVVASVTVSVGTTSVTVDLPAIPVVVPGIGIPTLMMMGNKTSFGVSNPLDDDTARFVMVPNNSPIGTDLVALKNLLNMTVVPLISQLAFLPTPPWWAPGLLGTLGTLLGLVNSYTPVGDRYPLVVVQADRVSDASSISYSSGWTDDFDDEDQSVLLIGVKGQKLSLSTDDDLHGRRMDIVTGSAMFVIINDLGHPTTFDPQMPPMGAPLDYEGPSVTNQPAIKDGLEGLGFNQS